MNEFTKIMTNRRVYSLMIFLLIFMSYSCDAQNKKLKTSPMKLNNRKPAVAGQFYPGNAQDLKASLKEHFQEAKSKQVENTVAIISPHAGYIYSGTVAASAFNQIDENKTFKNIFVITSSHRVAFEGASIYNLGNYETPLGEVKVNLDLANKLIDENECFTHYIAAHMNEHSLEVQLPFLQYKLKHDFQIIPIVVGTQSKSITKSIAGALKPYFNKENLFVISSDFSHYPSGMDAIETDSITAEAIVSKSPEKLIETLGKNEKKQIENLATSLCGWSSVLTLLHLVESNSGIEAQIIDYAHSGEVSNDNSRVVGYNAIAFYDKKSPQNTDNYAFDLNKKDKEELLQIARQTIENLIIHNKETNLNGDDYSDNLNEQCGAFVTLHKHGKLRGCIGRFTPNEPLYEVVRIMAIAASTQDYRFSKVTEEEVDQLEIEISVLTPLSKIDSVEEIEVGKHGIYIKKGSQAGTLLPQVATDNGWDREEFLGYCSQYKAGIGKDGWKTADVYVYEAIVFSEEKKKD